MTNPTNGSTNSFFTTIDPAQWSSGGWTTAVPQSFDISGAQFAPAAQSLQAAQAPQPPTPTPEWSPRSWDFYFDNSNMGTLFLQRRAERQSYLTMSGSVYNEAEEHKLVDKLWRAEYGEPWPGLQTWSYPDLDLDKLDSLSLRKYPLQPFKIEYQTYQEIKLRLYNTVIGIKGHPFSVVGVAGEAGNWKLAVSDGVKKYCVKYSDLTDLRSMPPMYITQNYTGWLCRHPGRVYQQGMNRQNTSLRSIDGKAVLAHLDQGSFCQQFRSRSDRKWEPTYHSLMKTGELPSLRLSDDIAVTKSKSDVVACYRGRPLGKIVDNTVCLFDEDDALQQWIERSAKKSGLELAA